MKVCFENSLPRLIFLFIDVCRSNHSKICFNNIQQDRYIHLHVQDETK